MAARATIGPNNKMNAEIIANSLFATVSSINGCLEAAKVFLEEFMGVQRDRD